MSSSPEPQQRHPHAALRVLYAVLLLVGGAGVIFTCVAATREPPPGEAAIRKLLDDQAADWNRGDLEAFMAGYSNSPELSFYSGKDKQRGWQETFDRYRSRYQAEGKEMGTVTFSELDIQMIGPDTALVRGRWKVAMKKENPEGLFTLVVKRLPAGWRIVHDHTSSG